MRSEISEKNINWCNILQTYHKNRSDYGYNTHDQGTRLNPFQKVFETALQHQLSNTNSFYAIYQ